MEARHEIIAFDQASPIRLFMHKLGDVSRHWHESLELLFVLAGEVTVLTGDRQTTLHTEDMLMINSNVIHELHSQGCVLIAVQIKLSKFDLPRTTLEQLYFDCDSTTAASPAAFLKLKQIITSMLQINTADDNTVFRSRALAYELLGELLRFKADKPAAETNTQKHLDRLSSLLQYIGEHCEEQLTLSHLADREHLSAPYLSSFFEKYMGVTFSAYYTTLRLERAMHDLLYTDLTVEQVATKHGFSDPRAYVRAFKKHYHMLPSQYRKEAGSPDAVAAADPLVNINYLDFKPENYFHILSQYMPGHDSAGVNESSVPHIAKQQSLQVQTTEALRPLHHHWRNFVGVGRAKDLLYGEVQEMLRQLQQDVGFRYLRFHGIFSDDMLVCRRGRDGMLQFNFTLIDKALDFALSLGLKPLIQFSFMPEALAAEPEHTVFANPVVVSMPRNMGEWNVLVELFLTHIRHRYGQQEIRSWLFSVWNEPDTSRALFGFARQEDFFSLYENTYRTVKAFDDTLTFGTPSLFPISEESTQWMRRYLAFTTEQQCRPQFLDIHYYSDDFASLPASAATFSNPVPLHRDADHFSQFITQTRALVTEAGFGSVPLYITEWNLTVSHRNLINDTCFKATYLAKSFLENYDRVDAIGYWALTDFLDEQLPVDALFHGGMGLYTANGIKKPPYHAMKMLAQLGDTLLAEGRGYFLTRRKDGTLALMLYNYAHCNPLLVDEGLGLTPTRRDGIFPNSEPVDLHLTLTDLPAGTYRVRDTILNQQSGSSFDQWVAMGAAELQGEDVEYLRRSSEPAIRLSTLASNGTATYHALLAPHEVRLVEISPAE